MEGSDRGVVQAERGVQVDALLHRGRGLLGEGEREDLVRLGPARRDELDDAGGEDVGLAGPGAGHDEQWAFAVLDRLPLLRREQAEDVRSLLAQREAELLGHSAAASSAAATGCATKSGREPRKRANESRALARWLRARARLSACWSASSSRGKRPQVAFMGAKSRWAVVMYRTSDPIAVSSGKTTSSAPATAAATLSAATSPLIADSR